jgi:hypothetical protein
MQYNNQLYWQRYFTTYDEYGKEYGDYIRRWRVCGRYHRIDGPAFIEYHSPAGSGFHQWYYNGKLHCETEAAYSHSSGYKAWYHHGYRHRVGGPAIIRPCGTEEWWINGKQHRVGGPAVTWNHDGSQKWCLNGELHRVDGPAVIVETDEYRGYRAWYLNGMRHRTDGPAVIDPKKGIEEYWINDERKTREEVLGS